MRDSVDAQETRQADQRVYPFQLTSIAPQVRPPSRCSFTSRRSLYTFSSREDLAHS